MALRARTRLISWDTSILHMIRGDYCTVLDCERALCMYHYYSTASRSGRSIHLPAASPTRLQRCRLVRRPASHACTVATSPLLSSPHSGSSLSPLSINVNLINNNIARISVSNQLPYATINYCYTIPLFLKLLYVGIFLSNKLIIEPTNK